MKIPEYTSLEEKGFSLKGKNVAKPFAKYHCILEANSFDAWYKEIKNIPNCFFRGVKEAKYKNFTSAQRLYYSNDYLSVGPSQIVQTQIDEMRKVHDSLLQDYCKSINIPCTDLFLMSSSQHHKNGISPLLDFTTDLDTSLFFMCNDPIYPLCGSGTEDAPDINNFVSLYIVSLNCDITSLQLLCDKFIDDIRQDVESELAKEENNILLDEMKKKKFHKNIAELLKEYMPDAFSYKRIHDIYKSLNHKPILIQNVPLTVKIDDYETKTKLTVSNLNIIAQHGCFLYHDAGKQPLEKCLVCIDVHKSLIPYIVNKYLRPNNIDRKKLFPTEDKIVEESTFNMMANIVNLQ